MTSHLPSNEVELFPSLISRFMLAYPMMRPSSSLKVIVVPSTQIGYELIPGTHSSGQPGQLPKNQVCRAGNRDELCRTLDNALKRGLENKCCHFSAQMNAFRAGQGSSSG
jgi:hypothetical protein